MQSEYMEISRQELLSLLFERYGIQGAQIKLHRESGGRVYYIQCADGKKVFKLYRPIHADSAIQSTRVISYLDRRGYPVVKMIPAVSGEYYVSLGNPDAPQIGVMFEFSKGRCIGFLHRWRDGKQPIVHPKAKLLGRQVAQMHCLMEDYDGPLVRKGREHYIDNLIARLRGDGHDEAKVCDLEEYGNALWSAVEKAPSGFCHGDMHTGNTTYRGGWFTWMDFDRASDSHPVIDVGWLTDGTDFNVYDAGAFDRSRRLFDELYAGYGNERVLIDAEINAVFHCTALIHYDLFSSFVVSRQLIMSKEQLDEQHGWLMRWRDDVMRARFS